MSFRKNPAQQMSLFDTTYNLTEREKKALLTMPVKRTDHKGRRLREGESQKKIYCISFDIRMRTESDVRSMLLI